MKKQGINVLIVCMALLVTLSACGSDNSKTITFWTPLTGEDGAYMDQLVEDYNATNPDIKVKHVITADMYTKLSTVLNTGKDIPDLAIIHADRVPGYVKQGMLEPMTEDHGSPAGNSRRQLPAASLEYR